MRAGSRHLVPSLTVIAVFAHTWCVVDPIGVRASCDLVAMFNLLGSGCLNLRFNSIWFAYFGFWFANPFSCFWWLRLWLRLLFFWWWRWFKFFFLRLFLWTINFHLLWLNSSCLENNWIWSDLFAVKRTHGYRRPYFCLRLTILIAYVQWTIACSHLQSRIILWHNNPGNA